MKKINLGQKEIIHFVGIGGIGMSGLAQVMNNMGFKIQGSDQNKNKNTANCLKAGIKIHIGHLSKNINKSLILRVYILFFILFLIFLKFKFISRKLNNSTKVIKINRTK